MKFHIVVQSLLFAVVVTIVIFATSFSDLKQAAREQNSTNISRNVVEIGGQTIHVSVATTPKARAMGLGGRAGLSDDEGMLFIFPEDGLHAFWMKDMHFSIDIVWVAKDGRIVYIVEELSPSSYPASFAPREPARSVLELPAGFVEEYGVEIGDIVRL